MSDPARCQYQCAIYGGSSGGGCPEADKDYCTESVPTRAEVERLIESQAARIEELEAERVSTLSVGGVQLTWQEAANHYREAADTARRYQSILFDLDRCEHGRHEGDVCSSCGGPSLGNPQLDRTRIVKGVSTLLPKRCIGFDLSARPIVVPMRDDPHTPEAWIARRALTEDTP